MVIDHIGIVVKSIEKGIEHWREVFGYRQMTDVVENSRQGVRVVFLEKEDSLLVKLVEPVGSSSSVSAFAKRGGGLHHLCFKTGSLAGELERLQGLGLRVLASPEPGEAFENEDIAFVYAKQGLNVEIIETDKKAARRPE
jgi:methylmalonyl-CoA/ethylmalonyl-CoA epimerase